MPVGAYGIMKTTLEKMHADAQGMLGAWYAARVTLRKMAIWMGFETEWVAYYRKKKHNHYH